MANVFLHAIWYFEFRRLLHQMCLDELRLFVAMHLSQEPRPVLAVHYEEAIFILLFEKQVFKR